jgi:hypothetical protein
VTDAHGYGCHMFSAIAAFADQHPTLTGVALGIIVVFFIIETIANLDAWFTLRTARRNGTLAYTARTYAYRGYTPRGIVLARAQRR